MKTKKLSEIIMNFVGKKGIVHFQYKRIGKATSAKKISKNKVKLAKVTLHLPYQVVGLDLRDLDEWGIFCIAIPKEKVVEFIES
ncbi:hypothetical protein GF322_00515 [Candidatus Dependentiae bacterium]|nr:hypothetical protein [Candidatus Dependentiae bacterium]